MGRKACLNLGEGARITRGIAIRKVMAALRECSLATPVHSKIPCVLRLSHVLCCSFCSGLATDFRLPSSLQRKHHCLAVAVASSSGQNSTESIAPMAAMGAQRPVGKTAAALGANVPFATTRRRANTTAGATVRHIAQSILMTCFAAGSLAERTTTRCARAAVDLSGLASRQLFYDRRPCCAAGHRRCGLPG